MDSFCRRTIQNAIEYLHGAQTPEGGWVGAWGICMTYATQFALESLSLVGETYETSSRARRACEFILSHQREDGGWGESYKVSDLWSCPFMVLTHAYLESCEQSRWVEHEDTQVVQTCWAVKSLMYAKYPHPEPIENAVRLVMSRQRPVSNQFFFFFSWLQLVYTYVLKLKGRLMASRSYRRSF